MQKLHKKQKNYWNTSKIQRDSRSSPVSTPRPSPVRRLPISGRPPEKSQSCGGSSYWGILRISIMQTLPRNA